MKKNRQSPQNVLAREFILEALLLLVERKKLQEISITELTVKAGVSRMTFYRNYKSKEDIIIQYLDEVFLIYLSEMQKIEDLSVYYFALNFFKYFKAQEKLIIALLKSDKTNILFDCFSKYLDSVFINIKDKTEIQFNQYNISFIAGGLYKTLIQWLSNGAIENENDMAEKISQIISRL